VNLSCTHALHEKISKKIKNESIATRFNSETGGIEIAVFLILLGLLKGQWRVMKWSARRDKVGDQRVVNDGSNKKGRSG